MFKKKEVEEQVAEPKAKPAAAAAAAAAVIEAMPDALLVLDIDGNIVNVNPAFAKLSGREPKEFIGKSFTDAPDIIPEEIEKGMKLIREILETGKPVSLEWSFRTKDGSTIPTLITGTVIKDSEGNPINFVASFRDITELKRAEAEKTRALAERAAITDSIPDGLMVVDLEGNIVSMNRVIEKILIKDGLNPKELIGKPALEMPLIRPEDMGKLAEFMKEVIEKGKSGPIEVFVRRPDGSEVWNSFTASLIKDKEGNPQAFVALTRDITDIKRAEEERVRAVAVRERAAIIDALADPLVMLNLDGEIISVNPALTKITGKKPEEVIGKRWDELTIRSEDIEGIWKVIQEAIETGEPKFVETVGYAADGREIPIRATGVVPKDAEGNPMYIITTFRDITEHKRLQEKEKEAVAVAAAAAADKARAEEAEKYTKEIQKAYEELKTLDTAKSDFISIAAHELKTPLSIIQGYCSLLQDGTLGKLDKIQKEKIGNVVEETERLIKLVEELLDVSAIEVGKLSMKMEKIAVDRIIKKVVSEFKPVANNKKQSIILEIPKKLPLVMGDSSRISTVFSNLVDNAVKYAPENGTIAVKAKEETAHLHFMVTDNDPGIPPKDLEKIFERFYTPENILTRKGGGMGLGLSICKGIIEAHQGKIWAESSGKGSTFHVLLPKKKKEE